MGAQQRGFMVTAVEFEGLVNLGESLAQVALLEFVGGHVCNGLRLRVWNIGGRTDTARGKHAGNERQNHRSFGQHGHAPTQPCRVRPNFLRRIFLARSGRLVRGAPNLVLDAKQGKEPA